MDILSEVLHVLQLKSTLVERVACQAGQLVSRPGKNQYQLSFLLRGNATIDVDGTMRSLRSLDGIWFGVGSNESALKVMAKINPTLLLSAVFTADGSAPHPLMSDLARPFWIPHDALSDETEIGRILALMDEDLVNERAGSRLISLRLADVLLVEMLRRRELTDSGFLAALKDPMTVQALERLHGAPGHRWNLTELSELSGLTPSAFGDRFQRRVGQPPLTYLRHWRLLHGKAQLRNSGQPIGTIAKSLGYRTGGGFSRAFRKQFNLSPSEFRATED
jgi:AraC-like DNA-binding protein